MTNSVVQQVAASQDSFKHIIEAAPCGMLVVNQHGKIQLVNTQLCQIFGYEQNELLGGSIEMLLPERQRNAHVAFRGGYMQAPSTRSMGPGRDLTGCHKDGSEFPVEVGISPIVLDDGSHGTIATVIDITCRKRLENNLRQANASLDQYNHIVSHDLKSPLRGIRSLLVWVREDLGNIDNEAVLNNFLRIDQRIEKMEKLIEDLLSFSRATRVSEDACLVNIPELINREIELQSHAVGFVFHVDCQEKTLTSSPTALATVLRNIISNAIKHHHAQMGNIYIATDPVGAFCRFTVMDDGPGVPENARERIFQLFQSLQKTDSVAGVGLAVCKRLIEAHGGSIEVTAAPQGTGSVFTFYWPKYARRDTNG